MSLWMRGRKVGEALVYVLVCCWQSGGPIEPIVLGLCSLCAVTTIGGTCQLLPCAHSCAKFFQAVLAQLPFQAIRSPKKEGLGI